MKGFTGKKMKGLAVALALTATVGIIGGCGSTADQGAANPAASFDQRPKLSFNPAHYPVTVKEINSDGKEQTFTYKEPPERIVAVWQNSIETLIALGVGDRIIAGIGVPDAKYMLPQNRAVYEKIPYKSLQTLSVESILSLKPDFILGWYSTFQDKVLRGTDFWLKQHVNTYIASSSVPSKKKADVHTLETEYEYIENLGKIFDREDKANAIVNEMKKEVDATTAYTAKEQKHPRALIMEIEERNNLRIYGKDTLAGNMLQHLGGELLLPDQSSTTMEQIVSLKPDVIFLVVTEDHYANSDQYRKQIYDTAILKTVPAVQNKRVFVLPLYSVYSAGIRTLDGLRIMSRGLYPDLKVQRSTEFPSDPKVDAQFNGE